MLNTKEMQKRVRGGFNKVKAVHAKANVPVSYSEEGKILNLYADGKVVDVTANYKKSPKKLEYSF